MEYSCYHAYYKAVKLSEYTYGYKRFVPVFASSDIEIYPYQLAAAQFAIAKRNEWLIDNASFLIAYIDHEWGRAYRTFRYAKRKKHIKVINIANYYNFFDHKSHAKNSKAYFYLKKFLHFNPN